MAGTDFIVWWPWGVGSFNCRILRGENTGSMLRNSTDCELLEKPDSERDGDSLNVVGSVLNTQFVARSRNMDRNNSKNRKTIK